MKFCKCVEQPQDYEKLIRLIEGGQELAAMDRINQMLAKTPNAAWLLALKGELALGMQEFDVFKETANRFLKLKPDNPLALIMKSLASSLDEEPVENSAQYLLGGLAESRESLPAMTLVALQLLLQSLARADKLSLAGYWADLQQTLQRDQPTIEPTVLQDQAINLITKVPARLIEDPPGAAWKERLAEVVSLTRIFSFSQAETKLRSILRDFPDQPGPLSQLLRAQMAQLNQSGAQATAAKLSEHLELSGEDRAYYAALAFELEDQRKSLQTDGILHYAEVDSIERIMEALEKQANVDSLAGEQFAELRQYYATVVDDEVPARMVYEVYDKALPAAGAAAAAEPAGDGSESAPQSIASSVASVVLYAKQTDKPARCLFISTRFPRHQSIVDETLSLLQLGGELELESLPFKRVYIEFLQRPKLKVDTREAPTVEELGALFLEEFLELPLPLFDGATPREAAQQEHFRGKLTGLLCHLEGEQGAILPSQTIGEIYQQLGLERPAPTAEISDKGMRITKIIDLDRFDLSSLSDAHLQGVLVRSMNLGASRAFYHCSLAVRQRENLADVQEVQITALSALKMFSTKLDEKIAYSRELIERMDSVGAPVGRVVIELVQMLATSGQPDAAQRTMIEAVAKYPDDPYLVNFMQYIMQQGQGRRGGMPSQGADDDELTHRLLQQSAQRESSSGLVLPGQEGSAGAGESKLWLPGS